MGSKKKRFLRKVFMPDDNKTLVSDTVVLSVSTLLIATFMMLAISQVLKTDNAAYYPCAGPGFTDFGCDGGIDGVIADGIGFTLFAVFFLAFITSLNRTVYRYRMNRKSNQKR